MPAIITHDTFAKDLYDKFCSFIGTSRDEAEAFLLGNQGPDPLFYSVVNPKLKSAHSLGQTMHKARTNEILASFGNAVETLPEEEQSIARAYVLGFWGHYLLDSTLHPLVYSFEYKVCDAGIPRLDRKDHREVHAVIESEYDEMVLYTRFGETVATFDPSKEILRASAYCLRIISKLYTYVAQDVFGLRIPENAFGDSVKMFRFVQGVFRSPSGIKRSVVGRIETLVRRHSFFRAMSHRALPLEESQFENRDRNTWINPRTGETRRDSFWDLYEKAQDRFPDALMLVNARDFDIPSIQRITHDMNFSGALSAQ